MNIKKIFAGVFACCVVGGVLPSVEKPTDNTAITANAIDESETGYTEGTYESLTYINWSTFVSISNFDESATEVVIPSEIEGLPVTTIDNNVFNQCSDLTSVVIPNSVTSIGHYAFANCENLTSIVIPDSVTDIGEDAFSNTPWFESKQKENPLVIINGILIDATTYSGNEIIIPDNVITIGKAAFFNCSNLASVIIPNSVTYIDAYAFADCDNLTSIEIPYSVKRIQMHAFYGCSGLKSVIISDGVTGFGGSVFEGCSSLTSIEMPYSVKFIMSGAFKNCNNLTSIKILNPECYIHDISYYDDSYEKTIVDTITIYGYDDSTAQTYAEEFGNEFVSLGEAPTTSGKLEATLFGDANCDGHVTIADATAIIQHLGNEDEYGLSAQGFVNADCYNPGDGVSGKDANAIKMFEAGMIDSLPVIE